MMMIMIIFRVDCDSVSGRCKSTPGVGGPAGYPGLPVSVRRTPRQRICGDLGRALVTDGPAVPVVPVTGTVRAVTVMNLMMSAARGARLRAGRSTEKWRIRRL